MLGSLILYLKGMRRMMFQLSGFYYKYLTTFILGCVASHWGSHLRIWGLDTGALWECKVRGAGLRFLELKA